MCLLKKIFIAAVILVALVYCAGYIFLAVNGKRVIVDKLKVYLGKDVVVGSVIMANPWKFIVRDVQVDGIGQIAAVELSPSVLGFVTGKTILYKVLIVRPAFSISRQLAEKKDIPEGNVALAVTPAESPAVSGRPGERERNNRVIFYKLQVVDGTLVFRDFTVGGDSAGVKLVCSNIDASVTNVYEFPNEIVTKFEISADVPWIGSKDTGKIQLDGWINSVKKDMRAQLVMTDIDALSFYPYYASWFSLDKSNIQRANLQFTSNVTGLNNDVNAACHLEITEVSFKHKEGEETESREERIAHKVLDFIKAVNNGKIVLDFNIKTRMDSPDFGMNVIKSAFESTIMRARNGQGTAADKVIAVPGKVVEGTVKSVSNVSSALVDGLISFGKELGKSIRASFSKDGSRSTENPSSTK